MSRRLGISLLAFSLIAMVAFAAGQTISVIVKKTSIRADKQFFAKTITQVKHKDTLEVLEEASGWYKVSFNGKKGWVHSAAVGGLKGAGEKDKKKKKGLLSFLDKKNDPAKVSRDEVALAGKGFNEKVEKSYKKKNPKLNFSAVDKMEKTTVKEKKLSAFITKGKLEERELKKPKKKGFFGLGS